jgi:hypothetical protein
VEASNSLIAVCTKQTPNLARDVAVVHGKSFGRSVKQRFLRLVAYGANIVLRCKHPVIVGLGQRVSFKRAFKPSCNNSNTTLFTVAVTVRSDLGTSFARCLQAVHRFVTVFVELCNRFRFSANAAFFSNPIANWPTVFRVVWVKRHRKPFNPTSFWSMFRRDRRYLTATTFAKMFVSIHGERYNTRIM